MTFRDASRAALGATLALAPIVFAPFTSDVVNLPKITVLWFGLIVSGVLVGIQIVREARRPHRGPMWIIAGIYLLAVTSATIFSTNHVASVLGLQTRYGGLVPRLSYAAIGLVIVLAFRDRPERLLYLGAGPAIAGTICSLYMFVQRSGRDWIAWTDPSGKTPEFPIGTMGNSNFAGAMVAIGACFSVALAFGVKRRWARIAWACMAAVQLLALAASQSRGAMIGALLGAVMMAIVLRDRLPRWAKFTATAGTIMIVAIGAVMFARSEPDKPASGIETFRTETLRERGEYWGAAWRIFVSKPLTGTGPDTFYFSYPKHRSAEAARTQQLRISDKPHNVFLEVASDTGVPGALSYVVLLGYALWRSARRRGAKSLTVALAGYAGALGAYTGQAVFSIDVPPLALMAWVALAGIDVLTDPKVKPQSPPQPQKGKGKHKRFEYAPAPLKRRPIPEVALAVLGLTLVWVASRPIRADVHLRRGFVGQQLEAPPETTRPEFAAARRIRPAEPVYWALSGGYLEHLSTTTDEPAERRARLRRAAQFHVRAYELHPGNVTYVLNVARTYTLLAQIGGDADAWRAADRWWARAREADPRNPEIVRMADEALTSRSQQSGGGGI